MSKVKKERKKKITVVKVKKFSKRKDESIREEQ